MLVELHIGQSFFENNLLEEKLMPLEFIGTTIDSNLCIWFLVFVIGVVNELVLRQNKKLEKVEISAVLKVTWGGGIICL